MQMFVFVQFLKKVGELVTCPLWALMAHTVLEPVEPPQVQFLDEVMATTTCAVVQTV